MLQYLCAKQFHLRVDHFKITPLLMQCSFVASTDGKQSPVSKVHRDREYTSICTLCKRICESLNLSPSLSLLFLLYIESFVMSSFFTYFSARDYIAADQSQWQYYFSSFCYHCLKLYYRFEASHS